MKRIIIASIFIVIAILLFYRGNSESKSSDYLPGDILSPWEGGPGYYSRWKNGPSTDEKFFPVCVWLQDPVNSNTAEKYKDIGINTFIGLWKGPTENQLAAVASLNVDTFCEQNSTGLKSVNSRFIKGWMHADEPDNAQNNTLDPVPAHIIMAEYNKMKKSDPSRPVYLNLGQGAAVDSWYGRGNRTNHPEDYALYARGADIISFDIYPGNVFPLPESHPVWFKDFNNVVAGRLWYVAAGVDRLRAWSDYKKPVWVWIETTNINGDKRYKLTPENVRSEVWMAVIHGARGVGYFCHVFKPGFIEAGLLADSAMADMVHSVNDSILDLAPVLNTQSVKNGVITAGEVQVDAMVKRSRGYTYVFAVAMRPGDAVSTFTLRSFKGHSVAEVVGENRTVSVRDGIFRDAFKNYDVHIYKIKN